MAGKKKSGEPKMAVAAEETIKHVRMEMPESFHVRAKEQADRFGLSLTAYIRLALTERVEKDERSAAN